MFTMLKNHDSAKKHQTRPPNQEFGSNNLQAYNPVNAVEVIKTMRESHEPVDLEDLDDLGFNDHWLHL